MNALGPIVCDTSALIALIDVSDPDHKPVSEIVAAASGPFIISPLVVAETDHLLRKRLGVDAARMFADDIVGGAYELASLPASDLATCVDVDRRYADLGLGLADGHVVVLGQKYRTVTLLTLDERHMRAVRPLYGSTAFRLLPADW